VHRSPVLCGVGFLWICAYRLLIEDNKEEELVDVALGEG
jgi:hypothetical protein